MVSWIVNYPVVLVVILLSTGISFDGQILIILEAFERLFILQQSLDRL